jgi:hypothetical protein
LLELLFVEELFVLEVELVLLLGELELPEEEFPVVVEEFPFPEFREFILTSASAVFADVFTAQSSILIESFLVYMWLALPRLTLTVYIIVPKSITSNVALPAETSVIFTEYSSVTTETIPKRNRSPVHEGADGWVGGVEVGP